MSEVHKLPKGWRLDVFPGADQGVLWLLFQASPDGCMYAVDSAIAASEADAVEAARKAVAERAPEPPAPPAWMVEVAREANAQACEKLNLPISVAAYRSGTEDGSDAVTRAVSALRLALERGHVVEPRPAPSDEEMLWAARKDAAQANERGGCHDYARRQRSGLSDHGGEVQAALQARRNMLKEMGAVAVSAGPAVDWEGLVDRLIYAVNRHWTMLMTASGSTRQAGRELQEARAALLSTLIAQEADHGR